MKKRINVFLMSMAIIMLSSCSLFGTNTPTNSNETISFDNKRYSTISAVQNDNGYMLQKSFKDTVGNYYYMFYLGRVVDVPLTSTFDYHKYSGTDYSVSLSVEYATEKSIETQLTTAQERTVNVQDSIGVGVNFGFGKKDVWNLNFSAEFKHTWGSSTSDSWEKSYFEAVSESKKEKKEVSIHFNSSYPKGYYRYMYFGTIDVFTFVVKDAESGKYYYVNASSIVSSGYAWDYSETDSTFSDNKYGSLVFDTNILKELGEPTDVSDLAVENGTAEKPFLIKSVSDFANISRLDSRNTFFKLVADIDFKGYKFHLSEFNGILNGNGHRILNYNLEYRTGTIASTVGMFGTNNGTIENVVIENPIVKAYPDFQLGQSMSVSTGVLCGVNKGVISNVKIKNGFVRSDSSDIAIKFEEKYGYDPREISMSSQNRVEWFTQSYDCHVNLDNSWINGMQLVLHTGGLVGDNYGEINQCEFIGDVDSNLFNMNVDDRVEQQNYVGGLVGYDASNGIINNCISEATITAWIELDNNGNGLGWVGDIYPKGICYTSGLVGLSGNSKSYDDSQVINSNIILGKFRVYAPQYAFLAGANYNSSTKGHTDNVVIKTFDKVGRL